MIQPAEGDDEYDLAAYRILDRLDPEARAVMAAAGKRIADDAADRDLRRRHLREASHDVADAWQAPGGPAAAQAERQRIDRARAVARERADRIEGWPGRKNMTDEQWQRWLADNTSVPTSGQPATADVPEPRHTDAGERVR